MKFLKKTPLKFWVILAACLLIGVISYFRFIATVELITYDFRFRLRPPQAISKDIVLIEIADDTLKSLNQWPLPRGLHAVMLDALREAGARAVVLDIFFSEETSDDETFSRAIAAAGNVYLPVVLEFKEGTRRYVPPAALRINSQSTTQLSRNIRGSGYINAFTDKDGKIRKIPLFIQHQDAYIPQLTLQVACDLLGLDTRKVAFAGKRVVIDERLVLPVSYETAFLVNFPGLWSTAFTHFSYLDILKAYVTGKKGETPEIDLSQLKGKICFVGLTATGTHDLKANPLEKLYPMVGLHASILNSILTKNFIIDVGPAVNTFINLFVFLITLLICFRFSPFKALVVSITAAMAYCAGSMVLFFVGIWIDLFLPLLVVAVTYVALTLYKFIEEVHKRQLIEKELEIAHAIQESFLPRDITAHAGIMIDAFMQPAKFVAGDLYDFVKISDYELGIFIGDVSGKGASASLIMAQTVSLFRIFSRQFREPHEVMNALNRELATVLSGRFVTATYVILDTKAKRMHGVCAGHLPVLGLTEGMVCEFFAAGGPPLGVVDTVEYEAESISLMSGERILLYTDGLIESRNKKGEEYGIEKLKNLFSKHSAAPVGEALPAMMKEFLEFCRDLPQFDDITAIQLSCP